MDEEEERMNIYVGNLAWEATDEDLKKSFEQFGQVTTASIIKDKFSGRSKGFGFVEMPSKEEGEAAIAALNEKDLKGRAMRVNEARPRTDDNHGGGDRGRGGDRDRGGRGPRR